MVEVKIKVWMLLFWQSLSWSKMPYQFLKSVEYCGVVIRLHAIPLRTCESVQVLVW